MDDAGISPDNENVNGQDDDFEACVAGITIETYAKHLDLPLAEVRRHGLTTVENPWVAGQTAVGIPYRRRDGSPFRLRIRQSLSAADSKRLRTLWDRREDKPGALLYGLDQMPAKGCPVLLVDDEALCHLLWFHGRDAIAVPGADGYFPKRDDPEIADFPITVIAPPLMQAERREELLRRLSRSKHKRNIRVAQLEDHADVLDLHRRDRSSFLQILDAAIAAAKPLVEAAPQVHEQKPGGSGEGGPAPGGTLADNLVTLAQRDGVFFADEAGSAWADVWIDGRRETWSLKSKGFKNWLVHRYYASTGRAPNADALSQALLTLDAAARYDGKCHSVRVRTGEFGGKYYLDLADENWRAIEIDAEGWRIVNEPPIRFSRPRGMRALPVPVTGGSISELKALLNLGSENDFILIVAWLVSALRPVGPYPLLALAGEPGATKSTTARLLRSLTDPNVSGLRWAPREERDCWIAAGNAGMLAFDNLSSIPAGYPMRCAASPPGAAMPPANSTPTTTKSCSTRCGPSC